MRDARERLHHILDAIERIGRYAARGEGAFRTDELIQNWFLRHLQVIGEAAGKLSQAWRSGHPEVPWVTVVGMRKVLMHEYFGIDLDVVWKAVTAGVPIRRRTIEAVLREVEPLR
ncbi:MAG: DUF86 domain-containing protein [Actinobacteria bacterium]|nr:DUF86 domain-containing protein [Actinomycetota bacterium]